jgi:predicted transcriptional regulator
VWELRGVSPLRAHTPFFAGSTAQARFEVSPTHRDTAGAAVRVDDLEGHDAAQSEFARASRHAFPRSAQSRPSKACSSLAWLPPQVETLAKREREVATIVYQSGACTAFDVEQRLSSKLTNASVRTMLIRLMNKGILWRERPTRGRGQQCIFLPSITPAHVSERALAEVANRYFGGSLLSLASKVSEMAESHHRPHGKIIETVRPQEPEPRQP